MSWKCTMLDIEKGLSPWQRKRPIGSMWYRRVEADEDDLSADYKAHRRGEPFLWVQLPDGPFCLDTCSQSPNGWVWTGTPPDITVTPSINAIGSYHGWIQHGVLTDDCEGRTYPPEAP